MQTWCWDNIGIKAYSHLCFQKQGVKNQTPLPKYKQIYEVQSKDAINIKKCKKILYTLDNIQHNKFYKGQRCHCKYEKLWMKNKLTINELQKIYMYFATHVKINTESAQN